MNKCDIIEVIDTGINKKGCDDEFISPELGIIKRNVKDIEKTDFTFNGKLFKAGERTTFLNFFSRPALYVGKDKRDGMLLFQIGKFKTLFGEEHVYNAFYLLKEEGKYGNEIVTVFQLGTARNFYIKNGIWQ